MISVCICVCGTDDLIKKSKAVQKASKPKAAANAKPAGAATKKKTKKPAAAAADISMNASKKKAKKPTRLQANVKKTVTVPVSKAAVRPLLLLLLLLSVGMRG